MHIFRQRMLKSDSQDHLSALFPALKNPFPLTVTVKRYLLVNDLKKFFNASFVPLTSLSVVIILQGNNIKGTKNGHYVLYTACDNTVIMSCTNLHSSACYCNLFLLLNAQPGKKQNPCLNLKDFNTGLTLQFLQRPLGAG